MRKLAMTLVAVAGLFSAATVDAQTAAASASITIPELLSINVTNTTIAFAQPAFTDYDAGEIGTATTSSISTRGNVAHDVTVASNAAAFTYGGGAGPDPLKPAADLQWSTDAGTSWNGLTTLAVDVLTNLGRGQNANAATVAYKMALDETVDIPGTYSLAFTYTVVAN